MTMNVVQLGRVWLFLGLILTIVITDYAAAARPDLILDVSKSILKVEYLPRHSGFIRVLVYLEDDKKRVSIGSRELKVVRGERFSTEFQVSVLSNCIYIAEVFEQGTKVVEVKNLYRSQDHSPAKIYQISQILKVPLQLAGEFLDKVTIILLSPTEKNLFRIDADGSNLQKLTSFTDGNVASPRISLDCSAVAFVRFSSSDPTGEIWVLHFDGGEPVRVAPGRSTIWSTDGRMLLYLNQGKLYELDLVSRRSREWPISDGEPLNEILGWSRDGSNRLLVTSQLGSDFHQPWLLNLDSGKKTRLPYDSSYQWLPYLSPSSTHIVFSEYSGAGGKSNIYIQEIGGSKRQLTDGYYDDGSPSWSPDSKAIIFASERP